MEPLENKTKTEKRAIHAAHEGSYVKAITILLSDGIHQPSNDVRNALICNHRQAILQTDTPLNIINNNTDLPPSPEEFTQVEVLKCIMHFPRSVAEGGSGQTLGHIKEILTVPFTQTDGGLLHALTTLINKMATVGIPHHIIKWLPGALLTPIRKRDGGVRPVAVGETICRIVSSLFMSRVTKAAQNFLEPLQFWVATKGGTEAIIHAVRKLVKQHGDDCNFGVLQVDLENAFNLVKHQAIMSVVRFVIPELYHWVNLCYNTTHPLMWTGDINFNSVTGVQRVNTLGTLLFSIPLQEPLRRLQQVISEKQSKKTKATLLTFYIHDGFIVVRHEVLQTGMTFLKYEFVRVYGSHLCV